MTREEAINEINKVFTSAYANYIVTALTEGATVSDKEPTTNNDLGVDCVRRKAVLNTLERMDKVLDEDRTVDSYKELLKECYKVLPSVTPQESRWIPVSEGLPKDIKPVQITWKNNEPEPYYQDIKGKHFTGTAHYKDGKWYWYSDVTEDFLAEYGRCDICEFDSAIEVVAWMPMAEPYETDG